MVVLGTNHARQGAEKTEESKKIDDQTYKVLIDKLVRHFSLDRIFEEASGCGPTTASKLQRPGLGHLDVDPPGIVRHQFGIPPGLPYERFAVLVSFGSDEQTDRVIAKVQQDGTCWCGGTVWKGRKAMRISVSSWATTEDDVKKSIRAMVKAYEETCPAHRHDTF
jgi:hypothetical protein